MCDDCPPGTYCLSGEGVQACPAGHYCLGGGVEAILPCPPGTYNPHFGLSQVEQCLICPAGESIVTWISSMFWLQHCKVSYKMFSWLSWSYFLLDPNYDDDNIMFNQIQLNTAKSVKM